MQHRSPFVANASDHATYLDAWEKNDRITRFYYYHLGVIDTKASVLLRINAIYFAVIAFVFSDMTRFESALANFPAILSGVIWTAVVAVSLSFLSTMLGLSVVWLHWFKLSELKSGEDDILNSQRVMNRNFHILASRTYRYRVAWLLSMLALTLVACLLLFRILIY